MLHQNNWTALETGSQALDRFTLRWFDGATNAGLDVPDRWEDFARLCRIRSGKKMLKFDPFDYQIELSNIADQYRGVIVFKTRQLGISETFANKFLHKACKNPAYASAVLSIGQDESFNISNRIKLMPQFPGFQWASESKKVLQPLGGGKMHFKPSTDNATRSFESISDLLFDEAAFCPNIGEMYAAATPSQEMLGDEARTYIVSTMSEEGKLSWFWNMFASDNPSDIDAEREVERVKEGFGEGFHWWVDNAGWAKVLVHWKAHPFYSSIPNYLEKTKREKKLTDGKLQREYNLGLSSGTAGLFDPEIVERAARGEWSKPKSWHKYLACIDPSFGGNDYFTCLILDIEDYPEKPISLVAMYREKGRSKQFNLQGVTTLLDEFEPVLTAVESNSGGALILEDLIASRPDFRFEKVNTNQSSKVVNTDRIILLLERDGFIYPPDCIIGSEFLHFAQTGNTREAIAGHNDDTVMGLAVGLAWLDVACQLSRLEGGLGMSKSGRG